MTQWDRCSLCPRLCRSACPVALGSGREAAVPAVMASILLQVERGDVPAELAAQAMTLCTDCGACQSHCHLGVPFPTFLREARAQALPRPAVEPLRPLVGSGDVIAVESDGRSWASALAEVLGEPVCAWPTGDALGASALHWPGGEARATRIRQTVAGREVVVADGGVAQVLQAAQVEFVWLRERLPQLPGGLASCVAPGRRAPLACCGGAGPLAAHHPDDARRVGALWLDRVDDWRVADARCRSHLRSCGAEVLDPVDALLAGDFAR